MIVVDTSFVIKLLKQEIPVEILGEERLMAPQLFDYEFSNVIWKMVKLSHFPASEAQNFFNAVEKLNIEKSPVDLLRLFHYACATGLTAYDASYLILAKNNHCALASFDKELIKIAQKECVPVVAPHA
ncbi:ribonuclease VapC9 [Alphaproteobacteria bacterium]|nr:ribonuclease VapC9 [Alphaproteobacteria bacterium]